MCEYLALVNIMNTANAIGAGQTVCGVVVFKLGSIVGGLDSDTRTADQGGTLHSLQVRI